MKQYIVKLLLSLLICITSCNGQIKGDSERNALNKTKKSDSIKKNNSIPHLTFITGNGDKTPNSPKSITRSILQDKNGIYWFATWEGIINYNGKEFTNVTLKEGLERVHIFSILEDKRGNIWFGTINGGVFRYDGKSFKHFSTEDGLAHNSVLCMLEDSSGNIWFGTEEGASFYNGTTFKNFKTNEGLTGNVNSIAEDKAGKIWFGTRYGIQGDLCYYDGKSFNYIKNTKGKPFSNVRSVIVDESGYLWIAGQDGLLRYGGGSLSTISTNFVGYIFEDKTGKLWLSENSADGWVLNKYDAGGITQIASSSMIFGIAEDRKGNVWFGTMDGVSRYDGKGIINY